VPSPLRSGSPGCGCRTGSRWPSTRGRRPGPATRELGSRVHRHHTRREDFGRMLAGSRFPVEVAGPFAHQLRIPRRQVVHGGGAAPGAGRAARSAGPGVDPGGPAVPAGAAPPDPAGRAAGHRVGERTVGGRVPLLGEPRVPGEQGGPGCVPGTVRAAGAGAAGAHRGRPFVPDRALPPHPCPDGGKHIGGGQGAVAGLMPLPGQDGVPGGETGVGGPVAGPGALLQVTRAVLGRALGAAVRVC